MNPNDTCDTVQIRNLRPKDLDRVVDIDTRNTGRSRARYFEVKLAQALADTGIQVSLAAELDGRLVGFLLARVYYGEFGATERSAVLDTIGVHPRFHGRGIGRALLRQLRENLLGLGIPVLRTEVSWEDRSLLGFFHRESFVPAARFCLDLDLDRARNADARREEMASEA
ncbi:MAG TPA: GNAT family N-acetyltransferase [Planctomycetota bacterium]|nr:GNAT family N-acetyltransferase [Planctomycetota bacterium]